METITRIGIIGAMEDEVSAIRQQMNITDTQTIASMEFCCGTLKGKEAVVVQCGMGKVNAGICAQMLISVFGVNAVVNTGVAGSLNNDINIGDIVVSTDALYHDVDATVFGYAKGEVPQLGTASFTADEMLRASAVRAIREADPDIQVFEGRVASGDQFICDRAVKNRIRDTFHADCCEMEGAAIAQASWINGIPFVIVRAISDKADESVTVSYDEFEGKAAEHCARLVEYMVRHF